MERLILVALIGSVTAVQMRTVRQEYAIMIGGATAVLLLIEGVLLFTGVSETLERLCGEYSVPTVMLRSVLKILGIAYLSEFGVNIAKDAGQQAIAGALEIGGRVLILSCALPSLVALLETGAALIREAAQ